jgi:GNAT superfamily N-acetyltransferase
LNTDLSSACRCFGIYDGETIVGFMGVLHQPHGVNKKIKRVSRLVILPDYQGIGIGYKFLCSVAKMYAKQGYTFSIVTSAKNLIVKLSKSQNWKMIRLSYNKCSSVKSSIDYKRSSMRDKCKTASFFFNG